MIASLTGEIEQISGEQVVISCAGVGYLVNIPGRIAAGFVLGERAKLHTVQVVREDDISLYGFLETQDRALFALLRSVAGIGPKLALAILGHFETAALVQAIRGADEVRLTKVSGLGAKTAKLLIVSLAGKLDAYQGSGQSEVSDARHDRRSELMNDAVAALRNLGISERQAAQSVYEAFSALEASSKAVDVEALVRFTLSQLGRSRTTLSDPSEVKS